MCGEVLLVGGWIRLPLPENWTEPHEWDCRSFVNLGNSKRKSDCYRWNYLSEMRTKRKPRFVSQSEIESIPLSQQSVAAA